MSIIIDAIRNLNWNQDWGKVFSVLLIRYVGVFVVLFILMLAMMLMGKIISALVSRQEAKRSGSGKKSPHTIEFAEEPEREAGEEEIVAAIGAAIALSIEADRVSAGSTDFGGATSGSWALAGRAAQMDARMQGGTQRRS